MASISAHESVKFLLTLIPFCLWLFYKGEKVVAITAVGLVSILSFLFFITFQLAETSPLPSTFHITWTSEYKINGQKLRGFATTEDGDKLYVVYTFHSAKEKAMYQATPITGRKYKMVGELVEPNPPAHEFAFSMKTYLKSKGAIGTYEVSSWSYVEKKKSIQTLLAQQRFSLKQHIEAKFPPTLVAEAQALLIGLQDNVDDELQRAYQKLGITHLFAISGLHVALVSFLFYEGLLRIGVRREFATIVLLIVLPAYGVLAGGAPSVWRAVSVVELIMIMRFLKWRLGIDDALAISFITFVLVEPGVIYQIGFQLSYLASASLIYSSVLFNQAKGWLSQSFLITFVCQLLVYPLLLFHFYEISISSLFVNIVFVPLFSFVILPMNIVLLFVTFLSSNLAQLFFVIYEPLRGWLTDFILFMQALPFQMWAPGKPSVGLVLLAMLSVFAGFYFLEVRRYQSFLLVISVPIIAIHAAPYFYDEMRITFLNVGQGDSTVIEMPFRKAVYVVDAGGLLRFEQEAWKEPNSLYEVGKQVVVPYLKGKGIREVDVFIVTHADADHVEGVEEVLEEIRMGEIHVTPGSLEKPVMNDLLVEAKKQKVPIKEKMQGAAWTIDHTQFHYLWPQDTIYEGNDDSLVLYIQQGAFKGLLTGDLEESGEQALLVQYEALLGNMSLLKAGHHGSKTSSTEPFVELLQPKLTIFSAGLNNRYGHPNDLVVERFERRGLRTITTGIDGTVEVSIHDGRMQLE
ncbi:MAG: DNA internalization-related competence protein ComEC/Rec2 [Lysinibacillus sp.]